MAAAAPVRLLQASGILNDVHVYLLFLTCAHLFVHCSSEGSLLL